MTADIRLRGEGRISGTSSLRELIDDVRENSSDSPWPEQRSCADTLSRMLLSTVLNGTTHIPAQAYMGPTDIHVDVRSAIALARSFSSIEFKTTAQLLSWPGAVHTNEDRNSALFGSRNTIGTLSRKLIQ